MTDPTSKLIEALVSGAVSLTGNEVRFDADTREDAEQVYEALAQSPTPLAHSEERATYASTYEAFTDGMKAAAEICGSLAETTYDDTDAFEAATGCEAAIMRVVQDQRREQATIAKAVRGNSIGASIRAIERAMKTVDPDYPMATCLKSDLRVLLALRTPNPAVDELVEAAKPIADQAEQMERFSDQMMKNAHTLVAQIPFDQIAALRAAIAKFRAEETRP